MCRSPPDSDACSGGNNSSAADERKKRPRTAFTPAQIKSLEAEFEKNKYLSVAKRLQLSKSLKLTETQVCRCTMYDAVRSMSRGLQKAVRNCFTLFISQSRPNHNVTTALLYAVVAISTKTTLVRWLSARLFTYFPQDAGDGGASVNNPSASVALLLIQPLKVCTKRSLTTKISCSYMHEMY